MTDHANLIRQAFEETLDILDERTKRAIIIDLECASEYDRNSDKLSIEKLAGGLRRLIGNEAAQLMIEDIFIKIDELCDREVNFHLPSSAQK